MAAPPDRPTPKLSIGLPVYNAQAFLPQALDCLLAQTFADFEIVKVVPPSSANTATEMYVDPKRRTAG